MMRARTIRVAAIAVAAVAAGAMARADMPQIRQRGALRVVVSADELPEMFSFEEEGPRGLERELVDGFAKAQGLSVEIVKVASFEGVMPTLLAGDGDLIIGMIATDERRRKIEFTAETMPARHLAVNRRPAPRMVDLDRLRASRVGVITDTSWAEAARSAGVPARNTVGFAGTEELLDGLRTGSVDAVVMSVTDFALSQRLDPELQAGCFVGPASSAAWGVRKEDVDLRAALDGYINGLRRSYAWSQLVMKYYSQEALVLIARARTD